VFDSVGGDTLTYTATGLDAGTSYTWSVVACNGESSCSPQSESTTAPTLPDAPAGVTLSDGSIIVDWDASPSSVVSGYRVYFNDAAAVSSFDPTTRTGFAGAKAASALTQFSTTTHGSLESTPSGRAGRVRTTKKPNGTDLAAGTSYAFWVVAFNDSGESLPAVGSRTQTTAPAAPTITGITAGNGQLSVAFTAGSDGGVAITGYQYSLNNGAWTNASGTISPIVITGLTNDTSYGVRLRAVNTRGDGTASASTTILLELPPLSVEYLVVGGGGGGGGGDTATGVGGGGGGGQVLTGFLSSPAVGQDYGVTVGSGAVGQNNALASGQTASTFDSVTASPGGSGSVRTGAAGGPAPAVIGGGAGVRSGSVGSPGIGSISRGGSAAGSCASGGGGGGAGGDGGNGTCNPNVPGSAGPGIISTITGTPYEYGRGGAGVLSDGRKRGGRAGTLYGEGGQGVINSGGAGADSRTGGNGANGVVILRIPDAYVATFSGGTNTMTTVPGFRIYTASSVGSRTVRFSLASPVNDTVGPTITQITSLNGALRVSFTPPPGSASHVANYQYSTDNGVTWVTRTPALVTSPILIGGLVNEVTYPVRLRAIYPGTTGAASAAINAVPSSGGGSLPALSVQYLVVGGGGAGGGAATQANQRAAGGGGGGGEVLTGTLSPLALWQHYTVMVGAGGSSGARSSGGSGWDSSFATVSARGGGGGGEGTGSVDTGRFASTAVAGAGGGGIRVGFTAHGNVTGGISSGGAANSCGASGGGGGAGGNGGDAANCVAGAGGAGVFSSITGVSYEYGRGGAGVLADTTSQGTATLYGQGASGSSVVSGSTNDGSDGTAGANGVVILRIPDAYVATFSGGTNTMTTVPGFRIYTVTSPGGWAVSFDLAE